MTEGDRKVMQNLMRKAKAADVMFDRLVEEMNDAMSITTGCVYNKKVEVPQWL